MLVPIVSKSTRNRVWEEVREIEARNGCFSMEVMRRLEDGENPAIADFMFRIFEAYKHKTWIAKAVAYGFFVYRMIELQAGGKLPVVSADIGAPMQEEFFNDLLGYQKRNSEKIMADNFQVIATCTDFVWMEAMSEDLEEKKSAAMVMSIGVVVYMFIHNQLEVNELNRSIRE